ncbi:type I-U CRISPR-associated protein Csx17 [Streptosporangium sp. NPDC000239]|uniref:type I-G CRISPR-associated protein Cas8g1/Csx17 n=1 Tax=Streptosporangium sp. NPDC000239 TaxID=3154248 RepID=UPI00332BC8F1
MNQIILGGCRADVLAGYLQALGLLRVVAAQVDPGARLHWRGDVAVLDTTLPEEDLLTWLVRSYVPAAIVSPWNSGSGFAGNGKSRSAEQALQAVQDLAEERFGPLRAAILAGRRVVGEGRRRGWGGKKDELWEKGHKIDVVRLCRNTFPDDALAWLDVAVTLTLDEVAFNALAGTGGNFGRQDLSATYYDRLLRLMGPAAKPAESRRWAQAALFGLEDVAYLRDTVGQYDPGRAGGIHSAADEKGDGFANPWSFVLVMEGTLLFASAAVRRNGTGGAGEAKPFFTRSTPLGHGSAAEGEPVKGEQWVPLWDQPAGAAEVAHLIGEGRARWRHRQATSGLEFAMALASLGVDRGLTAFHRFVIAERLGQNPLAIHAGRVTVTSRPEEALLRGPYRWLERVRRTAPTGGVATALRRVERELFAVAAGEGPKALARFVTEFGRLHESVGASGRTRAQVPPYVPDERAGDWLAALQDGSREVWLAAGFAGLHDDPGRSRGRRDAPVSSRPGIRALLSRAGGGQWQDAPGCGVGLYGVTLARALTEAHRIRAIRAQDERPVASDDDAAARGSQTGYPRGQRLPVGLLAAFAAGGVRDDQVADHLRGLLALGYRPGGDEPWPEFDRVRPDWTLSLLLPFFGTGELTVRVRDPRDGEGQLRTVRLAPRPGWVSRLAAGGTDAVAGEALLRLRMAGLRPRVPRMPPSRADGLRLAATLLLPVTRREREWSLARICVAETTNYIVQETEGAPA